MSKLEDLVPPLDLCKRIPEGAFAESALVWVSDYENWYVVERDVADPDIAIPAPTLEEILTDLIVFCDEPVCFWQGGWYVQASRYNGAQEEYDMTNSATAALKLWLDVNKTYKANKTNKDDKEE